MSYERVCRLSEYIQESGCQCLGCGAAMQRVITPPRLFTKTFTPFWSPVDGSFISNSRELSEHNKRNQVVQLHEGYTEEQVKSFTNKDLHNDPVSERTYDLKKDMHKAIQKLEEDYTPTPAPEIEELPDA